jgi:hypothetical protein
VSRTPGGETSQFLILSDAIEQAVLEIGLRATARIVGHPHSTIRDWEADLRRWPTRATLSLARVRPDVAEATRLVLPGARNRARGDARAIDTSANRLLAACGQVVQVLSDGLATGHLDQHDAARAVPTIRALVRAADEVLADAAELSRTGR